MEEIDILKSFLIIGRPNAAMHDSSKREREQWMYMAEDSNIQEFGTSINWMLHLTDKDMNIQAKLFLTEKEARGIMILIAGTMTESDYKVLLTIQENPSCDLPKLQMLLRANKKVAESVNKFIRNLNIVPDEQGRYFITDNGLSTLMRYNHGQKTLSGVPMKVVSLKSILDNMKPAHEPPKSFSL